MGVVLTDFCLVVPIIAMDDQPNYPMHFDKAGYRFAVSSMPAFFHLVRKRALGDEMFGG